MDTLTVTVTFSTRSLAGIPTRGAEASQFTPVNQPTTTGVSGSGSNGGFNNGGGTGGTLYLFTFLTTLLLLLAVSCGIVIRSFILRRRFHRRVEEAIAAGVLLPSQAGDIGMGPGGSINVFRRHIGEKPKMWEVWIDEQSLDYKHVSLACEWPKIQPVAATQVSDVPAKPNPKPVEEAPPTPAPTSVLGRITSRFPVRRAQRNLTPNNPTTATPEVTLSALSHGNSVLGQRLANEAQPPKDDSEGSAVDDNRSVQVTVFIAMPDPSRSRYSTGGSPTDDSQGESGGIKGKQRSLEMPSISVEDRELPEICIGVAQAQIMRDVSSVPSPEQAPNTPKS